MNENDTFYIHRVIHDLKFYGLTEVFLCESLNLKNEFDTVYVDKNSGSIFNVLKLKFEKNESSVLFFKFPLRATGRTRAEKRILENYGSAVKVELEQATFAGDMDAIMYADSRGATIAANAIAKICDDKLGKEALGGKKITKVVLKNDKTNSPKVTIDKGIMVLAIGFSTSEKYFSESELKEAIENML